jgi:hypothetical protein
MTPHARADENPSIDSPLLRFDFENDLLVSSDDAFTGGWSLQYHTAFHDTWPDRFSRGLIRLLPGMNDDGAGGRLVRRAFGLSQQVSTPEDLRVAEFRPDDVPWAGRLGVNATWLSLDNRRMAAVQVYVGCLGPCSHAEEAQRFIHEDLDKGPDPLGWRNQLDDRILGNLNYTIRYKLIKKPEEVYNAPRWASDLSFGSELGVGNVQRFATGFVEWRIGWSLPRGFTPLPDPVGMNVAIDTWLPPASAEATRWHIFFSLVGRITQVWELDMSKGGPTANGLWHPGKDWANPQYQVLGGVHLLRGRYSLDVVLHDYLGSRTDLPNESEPDWAGISLGYRF